MIMDVCSLCETEISGERPRYIANLEFSEGTRSAAQSGAQPEPVSALKVANGQIRETLCDECWHLLYEELTGNPPDEKNLPK
jgi:hypothetical protein